MTIPQDKPVFSRQSVRAVDAEAIERYGIPGIVLMENASRALADEAMRMLPDASQRKVLILCGPGNNGGDGFAAARHLHNAELEVTVLHFRPTDQYTGDARTHLDIIGAMGLTLLDASDDPARALKQIGRFDLIIDCLLGTGLASRVRHPLDAVIRWINHQPAPILACDIPSGLDCDTGEPLGEAVRADATVTFVGLKKGFTSAPAEAFTGRVVIADIGAPIESVIRHADLTQRDTAYGKPLGRLYDVFVDWDSRLSREMPGITARLESIRAKRVLDVGCGTGRHVRALRQAGYETHGADPSQHMLDQASAMLGGDEHLHNWALGEPIPQALRRAAPFDAVVCLGNTWSQIIGDEAVRSAAADLHALLRSGGLLLVGLKALAVRRESGNPYLPLLKREYEGDPMFFVRFVDFDVDPIKGVEVGEFHMIVTKGGVDASAVEIRRHTTSRQRLWSYAQLEQCFATADFADVRISGAIGDAHAPPTTEDVFVHAVR